jgi:hypothetical protein
MDSNFYPNISKNKKLKDIINAKKPVMKISNIPAFGLSKILWSFSKVANLLNKFSEITDLKVKRQLKTISKSILIDPESYLIV